MCSLCMGHMVSCLFMLSMITMVCSMVSTVVVTRWSISCGNSQQCCNNTKQFHYILWQFATDWRSYRGSTKYILFACWCKVGDVGEISNGLDHCERSGLVRGICLHLPSFIDLYMCTVNIVHRYTGVHMYSRLI